MTTGSSDTPKGERIAKRLARAGLCSRRDAERWVLSGRVKVDGVRLESPAFNVLPGQTILVDGNPLPDTEPAALWRYHKPSGLVTTNHDPQGRDTIFDKLPADLPRVITIGRLDLTTEGLLLLTNDGDLARFLELPSTGWTRRYRVRVNGRPTEQSLAQLADGVTIEGQRYDAIVARLDRQQGANAWLTMSLTEGKNREIRKVCDYLGLTVNRLIRVSYGPFQLGKLERSRVEKVPGRIFREQLAHWPGLPKEDAAAAGTTKKRLASKPGGDRRAGTKAPTGAKHKSARKAPNRKGRGKPGDGPAGKGDGAAPRERLSLKTKDGATGKPPGRDASARNAKNKNAHRRRKP